MSDSDESCCSPPLWASRNNGVVTVHGEVDISTCELFRSIVKTVVDDTDGADGRGLRPGVHLDLAGLKFIDVAGARVLVTAATDERHGLGLVVHHPPEMLVRIVQLAWGRVAGLTFEQARSVTTAPRSVTKEPQ